DFSATIEQNLAVNSQNGNTQKFRTTIEPRWDIDLSDTAHLVAVGRVRYDTAAKSGLSDSSDYFDLDLREFYVDLQWHNAYLRLGKQQIVWGQADGLRVLDVVNPFDLREFILPDFEDRRIPLWTVNVEFPLNDVWTTQLLWIPDQSYDELPDTGSLYKMTSPLVIPEVPAGVAVRIEDAEKPHKKMKDSDFGVRFSAFLAGWDVALNYMYHYRDQPVLYRYYDGANITVEPRYERSHLVGGSFSNVFGDTTLRAEFGYSSDRYFLTSNRLDSDGIVRSGEFSYVLGVDYQGWTDWFISSQVFQSILDNEQDGLVRQKVDTSVTLLIRRNFMNEVLTAEALLIQNMNESDGLLQVFLEYELTSNVQVKVGADLFYGSKEGMFGQFKENDRFTLGVEFGF
ncbi:MAG: hypothetical protein ACI92E_000083, partial [Oceanicoccus sp.]